MNRLSRDDAMMARAVITSQRSTCLRKQVGAVIGIDGRELSHGYAGAPSGMAHCTPDICNSKKPCTRTIHAEANAIAWAARKGIALEAATIYCTLSPCEACAKLLISSGIVRFVYLEKYRDESPILLLESVGIACEQSPLLEWAPDELSPK